MVSPSGRSVLSDGRVACTQWAAQMQPARQGRWNGLTFRRRLSAAALLLLLRQGLWAKLKVEQRLYISALLLGLVLALWAGLAALQPPGRIPTIPFGLH